MSAEKDVKLGIANALNTLRYTYCNKMCRNNSYLQIRNEGTQGWIRGNWESQPLTPQSEAEGGGGQAVMVQGSNEAKNMWNKGQIVWGKSGLSID